MTDQNEGVSKALWVKEPETAELLPVEKGFEYAVAITEFHQTECRHPATVPMRVRIAGGSVQVRNCCTGCGERIGTPLSQKERAWVDSLSWQSDELAGTYKQRRYEELQVVLLALARRQYAENGRFTASYRAYLQSPEWRARREKVMKRCGGFCEGCGDNSAVHVHHRTYRHFGNEFLFELLGLCRDCHERLHAEEFGEENEQAA